MVNKLLKMGSVLFASALVISGCGNVGDDADTDNREEADIITTEEKEGGDQRTGDAYGFTEFDLEIDVDNEDAVDVEYKVEEEFDPEYQNTLTSTDLEGKEAMDEIHKMFTAANFESSMSGEEARDEILKFYQIDHYSKFSLDIKFDDDTKMNYEDEQ